MKNRKIWYGAVLCLCAVLTCGNSFAEEQQYGDYVYVPAMSSKSGAGRYSLTVQARELSADGTQGELADLEGAVFGVYVKNSAGVLTAWANPLYPAEQMKIRSGAGAVSFSLPDQMEFYLKQESAPDGIVFDPDAVIAVDSDTLTVENRRSGKLVLSAADSLGEPIPGTVFSLKDGSGNETVLTADETGHAELSSSSPEDYTVFERELPDTALPAIRAEVNGEDTASDSVTVHADAGIGTSVAFIHPASGTVQLEAVLVSADETGNLAESPLAGVSMTVDGQDGLSVVTDASGKASAALSEGEYMVHFACDSDAVLTVAQGKVVIASGKATAVSLKAMAPCGRIVLHMGRSGGSASFAGADGTAYGPYESDEEGNIVSPELQPGEYRIAELQVPELTQVGSVSAEENEYADPAEAVLEVAAGSIAEADVRLLTHEKQSYTLTVGTTDENGQSVSTPITEDCRAALLGNDGTQTELDVSGGKAEIESLSGTYRLCIPDDLAEKLDISTESAEFTLPSDSEEITFADRKARLILSAVDENGISAGSASYIVKDSAGHGETVSTDASGIAVTPLMTAGTFTVEEEEAPAGYTHAEPVSVQADGGTAETVQILHETLGHVRISAVVRSLDENGKTVYQPAAGIELFIISEDGTGEEVSVLTDEHGNADCPLEEGAYLLREENVPDGYEAGDEVRFEIANGQDTQAEISLYGGKGSLMIRLTGGSLTDEEMAQIHFELTDEEENEYPVILKDGVFRADELEPGVYTLREARMPDGYTPASETTAEIRTGRIAEVKIPLEEQASISVVKQGLTFNDQMMTYVVPLSGEFGVYVLKDGDLVPYPSAEKQATVWSNVTPEQIAAGKNNVVRLPAYADGTTYYFVETANDDGFADNPEICSATVYPGDEAVVTCTVSSDRGFFRLKLEDAEGNTLSGGEFVLKNAGDGTEVLRFSAENGTYQNETALPVGQYVLKEIEAPEGYCLGEEAEKETEIKPYLTLGGTVSELSLSNPRIPAENEKAEITDFYSASQQGLTIVTAEAGAIPGGMSLYRPQMQIELSGAETMVNSVVLSGTTDKNGSSYRARVEYALADGGWQPSDARMSDVLSGPVTVSLADVTEKISAVRITWVDAETGLEKARGGFVPGQAALSIQAKGSGTVSVNATAEYSALCVYRTSADGEQIQLETTDSAAVTVDAEGTQFENASGGRDGRITGTAFYDADADGVLSFSDTERAEGITVTLTNESGDVIGTATTDSEGKYAFENLSAGSYTVGAEETDGIVYSSGSLYSEHLVSGIAENGGYASGAILVDAEHTDAVCQIGCIRSATVSGSVLQSDGAGTSGFGGIVVHLENEKDRDSSRQTITDDSGNFEIHSLLPGSYVLTCELPDGWIDTDREGSEYRFDVHQGDAAAAEPFVLEQACVISGSVLVDEDGDGIPEEDHPMKDAAVKLLAVSDDHTETVAETATDENGNYSFGMLPSGRYSLLYTLPEGWVFTGSGSAVSSMTGSTGTTDEFIMEPGENLSEVNVGVTVPAEMTATVWQDAQYDGIHGVYEKGLSGVKLSLIRVNGESRITADTVQTDENGTAEFKNVTPGEYVLAYEMPGLWRTTKQTVSADAMTSCVPQSRDSSGESGTFTLSMGQTGVQMGIGAVLSGNISGEVYYDDNANSVHDDGEQGCAAAKVVLLNIAGEEAGTTETDENGLYSFEGIPAGRYKVRFETESGSGFSGTERTMAAGGVQPTDSETSMTRVLTLTAGTSLDTVSAGIVRRSSVQGFLWLDSNNDCLKAADEAYLSDITVQLMNGTGRVVRQTAATDNYGIFRFEDLQPGQYKLRVTADKNYVFSGALSGSLLPLETSNENIGYSKTFELYGGAHAENIGYGLLTQGSIAGSVWDDSNYDGVRDENENGLRGVTVQLLDESGTALSETQADRLGEYRFDGLMPGAYSVSFILPDGYSWTAGGGDSLVDSVEKTAALSAGKLEMGSAIGGLCAGAVRTSSLEGTVWYDADSNGRRTASESGIPGVTVRLDITEGTDAGKSAETVTDENGVYRFEGVMPGYAAVTCTLPDGMAFTDDNGGKGGSTVPGADAQTGSTQPMEIRENMNYASVDIGAVGVGTLTGSVWLDSDYSGRYQKDAEAVGGMELRLLKADDLSVLKALRTDENGEYQFDFVREGQYVLEAELPDGMLFTCSGDSAVPMSDQSSGHTETISLAMGESLDRIRIGVIRTAEVTGTVCIDENEDGVRNEADTGLNGVTVSLMEGGTVAQSEQTYSDGTYRISSVRPGNYRLRYTLPDGTLFIPNVPLNLSNEDSPEGETDAFSLSMGEHLEASEILAVRSAEIAGIVWTDTDVSGTLGSGEPRLSGVSVVLTDGTGNTLMTDVTDENGAYSFGGLRRGEYSVQFTLPSGMLFTDSRCESDGSWAEAVDTGVSSTEVFTLSMGEKKDHVNAGGILQGSIGDLAWLDTNANGMQDFREPVLSGVRLFLWKAGENGETELAGETVTDEYGYYHFNSLRPGRYVLTAALEDGDALTQNLSDPYNEIDSDFDPETASTPVLTLMSGETLRNVDIGFAAKNGK